MHACYSIFLLRLADFCRQTNKVVERCMLGAPRLVSINILVPITGGVIELSCFAVMSDKSHVLEALAGLVSTLSMLSFKKTLPCAQADSCSRLRKRLTKKTVLEAFAYALLCFSCVFTG